MNCIRAALRADSHLARDKSQTFANSTTQLVDFGAFKGSDETHHGFFEKSEHEEEEQEEEQQQQEEEQEEEEEEPLSTNEVAAKSYIRRGVAQSWPPGAKKKRIICRVKRKSAKGQPMHLHPKEMVQETNFQREQGATVPASRSVQGRTIAGAPRRKRRKRRVQIVVGS